MRVLLDESLPRRLAHLLPGHEVMTVPACGWAGTRNGRLLALAAERFDAFVTADRNLQYQQNLSALPLAVVVLVLRDTRLATIEPLIPRLLATLANMAPRTLQRVSA
jgi:predicted nuclease of predicted toxin-antitoxin system